MKNPTHYVHCNSGMTIFVKTADFFKSQGGETEAWGKAWQPVEADSLEDARNKAYCMFPQAKKDLFVL